MPPKKRSTTSKAALKTKQSRSGSGKLAALMANNKSLAAALDELRQDYHVLEGQKLELQEERQTLLERLAKQDSKQMHYVLLLLDESEKKIKQARDILCGNTCNISPTECEPGFSPITDCKPHVCLSDKDLPTSITKSKNTYPKTPHPLGVKLETFKQLSSTPVSDTDGDSLALPALVPQAIDFDRDTPHTCSKKPDKSKLSTVSEVECSPDEGDQPQDDNDVSPGLPEARDGETTIDQLTGKFARPRRACSVADISYQEPSLISKLRRGDWTGLELSTTKTQTRKQKSFSACKSKQKPRRFLQDVTNKQ